MIDYSPLWETMKQRHISQYALINKGIDKHTLDQLRKNQNITILTVEKLCNILVNGKAYPCRSSMGAMLRFKKLTGKEVTEAGENLSEMCTYLFCCVASACKVDGIEFNMDLMSFADNISPEDMMQWSEAISEGPGEDPENDAEADAEKKS